MKRFCGPLWQWRVSLIVLGLAFLPAVLFGADSDFYRQFTNALGTNAVSHEFRIEALQLVDRHNIGWKFEFTTNNLKAIWEQGDVAGLHLGMTMSDVVAKWGKPVNLDATPRLGEVLNYSGASLWFRGDSLRCVVLRYWGCALDETGTLRPYKRQTADLSTTNELAAVLGSSVHESTEHVECCIFERPERVVLVECKPESGAINSLVVQVRENGALKYY